MSPAQSHAASIDPRTTLTPERAELYQIDQSTRLLALTFLGTAMGWLLVGSLFGLITSFKLHTPAFLADTAWLTFGVTHAVHLNAVIYGWASNAAIAVCLWLMARLCRTPLRHAGILYASGAAWNLALLVGLVGIMLGDMEPVEWLELPRYVTPWLFVSYVLIGVWGIVMFRFRRVEFTFVSQWYVLGALFWFAWLYSAAQIMLIWLPAPGVVQAIAATWYAKGLFGLWLTPVALAAAYYFVPKVLGRPISSYYLARMGFWALAACAGWTGGVALIGGPVPLWVQSAGIMASLLLVVPVIIVAINFHGTLAGNFSRAWESPTLRFIVFGLLNLVVLVVLGALTAFRSINATTQFTWFVDAQRFQGWYGFFTMVMFGAIYYMLPRLLQKEWPSSSLISLHFWSAAAGTAIYVIGMCLGGWSQGTQLLNPEVPFIEIVKNLQGYLFSGTVAGILIAVGHVAFGLSFAWMLLKPRTATETAPTLFNTPPPLQVKTT